MGMKAYSGFFSGTSGHLKYKLNIQFFGLKKLIKNLPKNPNMLISKGWKDVTHPDAKIKSNSLELFNPKTKHRLRFDKGVNNVSGFKSLDHYHVYNPNATGNNDLYLDLNGKPVKHSSKHSHILPKGGKK